MTPPHIPKIGSAAFQSAAQSRTGSQGQQQRQAAQQIPPQEVQAVVVSRSLELLETMASRVSETTGEACDAQAGGATSDGDPSYRVQLMSFIVGSLSRAAQGFREKAVVEEEPEPEEAREEEEAAAAEEAVPDAALPAVSDDGVEEGGGAEVEQAAPPEQVAGYGQSGKAVQVPTEGTIKRWA